MLTLLKADRFGSTLNEKTLFEDEICLRATKGARHQFLVSGALLTV